MHVQSTVQKLKSEKAFPDKRVRIIQNAIATYFKVLLGILRNCFVDVDVVVCKHQHQHNSCEYS